jgi:hypothetical protein
MMGCRNSEEMGNSRPREDTVLEKVLRNKIKKTCVERGRFGPARGVVMHELHPMRLARY